MDIQVATQVFTACEKTLAALTQLECALGQIEDEAERREMMKPLSVVISEVLCSIRGLSFGSSRNLNSRKILASLMTNSVKTMPPWFRTCGYLIWIASTPFCLSNALRPGGRARVS